MERRISVTFTVFCLVVLATAVVFHFRTRGIADELVEVKNLAGQRQPERPFLQIITALTNRLDSQKVILGKQAESLRELRDQLRTVIDRLDRLGDVTANKADPEPEIDPVERDLVAEGLVVSFDDLPPRAKETFAGKELSAVFITSFDGKRVGAVAFELYDEEVVILTDQEQELLGQMAPLYHDLDFLSRVVLDDVANSEDVVKVPSLDEAKVWVEDWEQQNGKNTRGWSFRLRKDGEYAIVDNRTPDAGAGELKKTCEELGAQLLSGKNGSFGVLWIDAK